MTTPVRLPAVAGAILAERAEGWKSPVASRTRVCFLTVSPGCCQKEPKVSGLCLSLPEPSLLCLSTLAWEQR